MNIKEIKSARILRSISEKITTRLVYKDKKLTTKETTIGSSSPESPNTTST